MNSGEKLWVMIVKYGSEGMMNEAKTILWLSSIVNGVMKNDDEIWGVDYDEKTVFKTAMLF